MRVAAILATALLLSGCGFSLNYNLRSHSPWQSVSLPEKCIPKNYTSGVDHDSLLCVDGRTFVR